MRVTTRHRRPSLLPRMESSPDSGVWATPGLRSRLAPSAQAVLLDLRLMSAMFRESTLLISMGFRQRMATTCATSRPLIRKAVRFVDLRLASLRISFATQLAGLRDDNLLVREYASLG